MSPKQLSYIKSELNLLYIEVMCELMKEMDADTENKSLSEILNETKFYENFESKVSNDEDLSYAEKRLFVITYLTELINMVGTGMEENASNA